MSRPPPTRSNGLGRAAARKPPQKTVASELGRLLKSGAITPAQYASYSASFNAALASEKRLHGTRATELQAVITNLHNIAVAGKLTPGDCPCCSRRLTATASGGPPGRS